MATTQKKRGAAKPKPEVDSKKSDRLAKLAERWGGHDVLLRDGFTPVPRTFLKYASELKPYSLSPADSLFVLNLMFFKWDARSPFPSYATLAARMGVSVQYTRDISRRLEKKGLLSRKARVGQPNQFDLQPLFDALARHVEAEIAAGHIPTKKRRLKVI